jgi:hypothetical protein
MMGLAVATLSLGWAAGASAGVTLDGGYASLNVRGFNSSLDSMGKVMSGAPIPYDLSSDKIENGFFVSLNTVMEGPDLRPGLKVEYVQSGLGHLHDEFTFIPGHVVYDERDTLMMLPIMVGVNPVLAEGGPFKLQGSLYAGYAMAMDAQAVQSQNWFFSGRPSSVNDGWGGGFVAEGGLSAAYRLSQRLSLNCNAAYRLAEFGELYTSSKAPVTDWSGAGIDFDMNGVDLGGGLSYAF